MGLNNLQSHITQNISSAVEVVDLLKLSNTRMRKQGSTLKLVVDGECCLDRLYGGYFPDWVCGGQWNKMEVFLRNFSTVLHGSHLDLVVFLNGSLEPERLNSEWRKYQEETYKFLDEINKHVTLKRKPPPKIWWVPPAYLRSAVRLAFRCLDMKIMCTLDDHHKDIIRFCQKSNLNGIIADDPEYLIFENQRYFSAQKLKLTFKGSLETVEVKVRKVFDNLNLSKDKFVIFAALLGNHMLSEDDLNCLFSTVKTDDQSSAKVSVIEKIGAFVRHLESTEPNTVAEIVVKAISRPDDLASEQLKKNLLDCFNYYLDETLKTGTTKGQKSKVNKKMKNKISDVTNGFGSVSSDEDQRKSQSASNSQEANDSKKSFLSKLLYKVTPDIEKTAICRHRSGLMSPYICHILKHREIKLSVILQDTKNLTDLPMSHDLFRPLRQRVYALLFNLHHLSYLAKERNEKVPTIEVKEHIYSFEKKTVEAKVVKAVELGWGVPTVEKLWLGDKEECKRKRIRAFLTIMKSDKSMILDPTYVPQEMIVLVCVLRYILSSDKKVLRKSELDAFIAQALIQDLTNPNLAQEIEIANLTMRGVHLSHLFMEGVDMALMANDACGAPVPFMLFCPWLFFNGKIFNYIMEQQQTYGKSMNEICGFKMDIIFKIDQMRIAALEGMKVQFAPPCNPPPLMFAANGQLAPSLSLNSQFTHAQFGIQRTQNNFRPSQNNYGNGTLATNATNGRGRIMTSNIPSLSAVSRNPFTVSLEHNSNGNGFFASPFASNQGYGPSSHHSRPNDITGLFPVANDLANRHRRVQPRGGQLEVAGTIVGSWGANYGNNSANRTSFNSTRILRNPRNPFMTSGITKPNQLTSFMENMHISSPVSGKNYRGKYVGVGSSNHWNQKRGAGRNQRKTKKAASGNCANNPKREDGTGGEASGSSKPKAVSFKKETIVLNKNEEPGVKVLTGKDPSNGKAPTATGEETALKGINESSLIGEIANELEA